MIPNPYPYLEVCVKALLDEVGYPEVGGGPPHAVPVGLLQAVERVGHEERREQRQHQDQQDRHQLHQRGVALGLESGNKVDESGEIKVKIHISPTLEDRNIVPKRTVLI